MALQKILVKIPSRSRPEKLYETLKGWTENQVNHSVTYLISYDTDDETFTPEYIEKIEDLSRTENAIILKDGLPTNKIEACNRDIDSYTEYFPYWDIIILASDDMVCQVEGWDNLVREKFNTHYPTLDGCLWFHDGSGQKVICTMPIIGREYYNRFEYIYHPSYKSTHCDNEFTEVAMSTNSVVFIDTVLALHEHHIWGLSEKDELYTLNEKYWNYDSNNLSNRRQKGFPNEKV